LIPLPRRARGGAPMILFERAFDFPHASLLDIASRPSGVLALLAGLSRLGGEQADFGSSWFGQQEGQVDGSGEGVDGVAVAWLFLAGVTACEAPSVADLQAGCVAGVVVEEGVVVVQDLAALDELGEAHAGLDDGCALEGFVGGGAWPGAV